MKSEFDSQENISQPTGTFFLSEFFAGVEIV
jgi:hypothetical protein